MKIIRNPTFTAPVKVMVPSDGGQREQQFTVQFRALTLTEQNNFDTSTSAGTSEFLHDIVVGWEGLTDEDGAAFDFAPANLGMLIDLPYIRYALYRAYSDATSGVRAAKRGN